MLCNLSHTTEHIIKGMLPNNTIERKIKAYLSLHILLTSSSARPKTGISS